MSLPKSGVRPYTPTGSFKNKQMAEATAFALSGVGPNGKPMVFEACQHKGKWAMRRVL